MTISASMGAAKREKWLRYIKRIEPQVFHMMDFRRWNTVYERVVNANPRLRPGLPVLDYFRSVYANYAALAVRRQAKPHGDAISLLELKEDTARFPEAITLAWTIEMYSGPTPGGTSYAPEFASELAASTFEQFSDSAGTSFDGAIATADAVFGGTGIRHSAGTRMRVPATVISTREGRSNTIVAIWPLSEASRKLTMSAVVFAGSIARACAAERCGTGKLAHRRSSAAQTICRLNQSRSAIAAHSAKPAFVSSIDSSTGKQQPRRWERPCVAS
jgi:hypothetical protein